MAPKKPDPLSARQYDALCQRMFTLRSQACKHPQLSYIERSRQACRANPTSGELAVYCADIIHLYCCRAAHSKHATLGDRQRTALWQESKALYRKATRLTPRWSQAWEGLAAVLDIEEHLKQAAVAARTAVQVGNDPDSVALLARILAQLGERRAALRWARHDRVRKGESSWATETAREVVDGLWAPIE